MHQRPATFSSHDQRPDGCQGSLSCTFHKVGIRTVSAAARSPRSCSRSCWRTVAWGTGTFAYDPQRKIIKSLFNGSRGPKFTPATPQEWEGLQPTGRFATSSTS